MLERITRSLDRWRRGRNEAWRNYFLALENQEDKVQKLREQFRGAHELEIDEVEGSLLNSEILSINEAHLFFPNLGFVPGHVYDRYCPVNASVYRGLLRAHVILNDEGLKYVWPQFRVFKPYASARDVDRIRLNTDGVLDCPTISDVKAFNGATVYLERLPKTQGITPYRWAIRIGQVVDTSKAA